MKKGKDYNPHWSDLIDTLMAPVAYSEDGDTSTQKYGSRVYMQVPEYTMDDEDTVELATNVTYIGLCEYLNTVCRTEDCYKICNPKDLGDDISFLLFVITQYAIHMSHGYHNKSVDLMINKAARMMRSCYIEEDDDDEYGIETQSGDD